jgi:hypothetical protein
MKYQSNKYKINLTPLQSQELIKLILNNDSKKYSLVVSIEYLTNSDCFRVIGFWHSFYREYTYYRDKDSKVFNILYEFMKPGIRNCRIEELGL